MTSVAMRRPGTSLAVGLGIAVGIVVLVVLVASIVRTMKHVKPVKSKTPPVSAVVWGDRVFVGPSGLSHWLKVRGLRFRGLAPPPPAGDPPPAQAEGPPRPQEVIARAAPAP